MKTPFAKNKKKKSSIIYSIVKRPSETKLCVIAIALIAAKKNARRREIAQNMIFNALERGPEVDTSNQTLSSDA